MVDGAVRSVETPVRVAFETRGSRFLGHLVPAGSVDEANRAIETVARDHDDATHVVFAYRIHARPPIERADDAGEPGGSAGPPALEVLRSADVEDVVAIVVRYYGGTQLGFGGLVRAYSRAVSDAIDRATVVERAPIREVTLEVGYDDSGTIRGILDSEAIPYEAAYDERVRFTVDLPRDREAAVLDRLRSATSARVRVQK